jgi:hypothetical protein
MENFKVDFYFDQGNTLTHIVKASSKESALRGIPTNGTYEFRDEKDKNVYRITISSVKYIIVSEMQ